MSGPEPLYALPPRNRPWNLPQDPPETRERAPESANLVWKSRIGDWTIGEAELAETEGFEPSIPF